MTAPISDGVSERLSEYLAVLGKHLWDRRQRASFAMYVLGLLSEQRRKSVEPIATLFVSEPDEADKVHQRLLHFLGAAPWPDDEVRRTAVRFALTDITRRAPIQSLIIDDTSFPKSGSQSVGVQRQYCGALGKVANCQVIVSLTAASERSHLPLDAQPYLPQQWIDSQKLREQAHISSDVTFRSKPELALSMLARAKANGVPRGVVLADAGHGDSCPFREGVRRLGMHFPSGFSSTRRYSLCETNKPWTLLRHCWREWERVLSVGTHGAKEPRMALKAHLGSGSRGAGSRLPLCLLRT